MNRSSFLFLGIFAALAFSWTGVILVNQLSYGAMTPLVDETEGGAFPHALPGTAEQGRLVYQDLGCASCHTQQVRRPGFGIDDKRGWGTRQSVAREYIFEPRVLLGGLRIGPDLRTIGVRKDGMEGRDGRDWHYRHLYDAKLTSPGSIMPSYRFLFETRQIVGQPSYRAIQGLLPADAQPQPGFEIVPTTRAEVLVSFLMNLKDTYAYPEAGNVYVAQPKKEGEAGAQGGHK